MHTQAKLHRMTQPTKKLTLAQKETIANKMAERLVAKVAKKQKSPAAVNLVQLDADMNLDQHLQEKIILEDEFNPNQKDLVDLEDLQLDSQPSISPSPEQNELLMEDLEN